MLDIFRFRVVKRVTRNERNAFLILRQQIKTAEKEKTLTSSFIEDYTFNYFLILILPIS